MNIKFPKELTGLVNPKEVNVLCHGNIYGAEEKESGKEFLIYREHNLIQLTNCFNVSKEYASQRELSAGDQIVFVEYSLNGRKMVDIFKAVK